MNWPRTILDGIAMALLFNAVVGVGFLIYPLQHHVSKGDKGSICAVR